MNKTLINNEQEFIKRANVFINYCDKLNYKSYKFKNSTILKRYRNNRQLFSLLCQVRDMFYDRIDKEVIKTIKILEEQIVKLDSEKKVNRKGLKSIDEDYFIKTANFYRIINNQIMGITTTWEDSNGKPKQLVY